jgi:hypothetical protein
MNTILPVAMKWSSLEKRMSKFTQEFLTGVALGCLITRLDFVFKSEFCIPQSVRIILRGDKTVSITILIMTIFGITTLSVKTFSIKSLRTNSITTHCIKTATQHSGQIV